MHACRGRHPPDRRVPAWLVACVQAVFHTLGDRPMIHRDIKLDNILLTRGPSSALVAKLADLGLTTVRPHPLG